MSNAYENQRKTLYRAAAALDGEAASLESSLEYHRNQIAEGEAKVERLRQESSAIKDAAGTLAGLDKAGVIIKTPPDVLTGSESPKRGSGDED